MIRYRLANCLLLLGHSIDPDKKQESFKCYQRGLVIMEELIGNDGQLEVKQNRLFGMLHNSLLVTLGNISTNQGNIELAKKYYERASKSAERFSLLNPNDPSWQYQELNCKFIIANLPGRQSTHENLLLLKAQILNGLPKYEVLSDRHPDIVGCKSQLARFYYILAMICDALVVDNPQDTQSKLMSDVYIKKSLAIASSTYAEFPDHVEYAETFSMAIAFARQLGIINNDEPLLDYFRKQLELEPNHPSWLEGIATSGRLKSNDAYTYYQRLLDIDPDNIAWLAGYSTVIEKLANRIRPDEEKMTKLIELVKIRKHLKDLDRTNPISYYNLESSLKSLASLYWDRKERNKSDLTLSEAMTCRAELYQLFPQLVTRDPFEGDRVSYVIGDAFTRRIQPIERRLEQQNYDLSLQLFELSVRSPETRARINDIELLDKALSLFRSEFRDHQVDIVLSRWYLRNLLRILYQLKHRKVWYPVQEYFAGACEQRLRRDPCPPLWNNLRQDDRDAIERMDYATLCKSLGSRKEFRILLALLERDLADARQIGPDAFRRCRFCILSDIVPHLDLSRYITEACFALGSTQELVSFSQDTRDLLAFIFYLNNEWHNSYVTTSLGSRQPLGETDSFFFSSYFAIDAVKALIPVEVITPLGLFASPLGQGPLLLAGFTFPGSDRLAFPKKISVNVSPVYWEVCALCERGMTNAAARVLEGLDIIQDSDIYQLLEARILFHRREFTKARTMIMATLNEHKTDKRHIYFSEGKILLARILIELGQPEAASKELQLVLKDHVLPDAIAALMLARTLIPNQPIDANDLRTMQNLTIQHPSDVWYKTIRSRQLLRLGQYDTVITMLTASATDPAGSWRPELHQLLGTAYLNSAKRESALAAYKHSLDAFPKTTQDVDRLRNSIQSTINRLEKSP